MSQTKKNIFTILALSPLTVVVNIIFTPIIINLFGISNYGIFSLMINLLAFSGLLNLGLGIASTRDISKISYDNNKSINNIINTNLFTTFFVAVFFSLILFFSFNFLIENIYSFDEKDKQLVFSLKFLISITIFLRIMIVSFRSYLIGMNKLNIAKINEIFLSIGSLIATYFCLSFGYYISDVFLIRLLPLFLYLFFVFFYLNKKTSFVSTINNFNYNNGINQLRYGLKSFININSPYIREIPLLLIGVFLSPFSVAIYTPFKMLINAVYLLVVNLNENLFPIVGAKSFKNKNDKINFFDSIFYNIIFYSFIFHIVFILFAKTIIDLWLGNTFSSQILVLYILSIGSFSYSISSALFYFSQGLSKPEVGRNFGIYLFITNMLLSIMFIPRFDIVGASISFSLSIFLIVVMMLVYFNNYILHDMLHYQSFKRIIFFVIHCLLIAGSIFLLNFYDNSYLAIMFITLIYFLIFMNKTNFSIKFISWK